MLVLQCNLHQRMLQFLSKYKGVLYIPIDSNEIERIIQKLKTRDPCVRFKKKYFGTAFLYCQPIFYDMRLSTFIEIILRQSTERVIKMKSEITDPSFYCLKSITFLNELRIRSLSFFLVRRGINIYAEWFMKGQINNKNSISSYD